MKLGENESVWEYFDCCPLASAWDYLGPGDAGMPQWRRWPKEKNNPNITTNVFGVKRQYNAPAGNKGACWDIIKHPLAHAETVSDIENYDWPKAEEMELPEAQAVAK